MENKNKLLTIAEMTKVHFAEHPEQPVDSIKEYITSLEAEHKKELTEKLTQSNEYYKQFQEAILHTSFIITLVVRKALSPELDLEIDTYVREFLFFARKDDKLTYKMRMYYLDSLTAQEMKIGEIDESDLEEITDPIEKDLILKEAENKQKAYDKLLENIKNQYKNSKIHLE